MLIDIIGYIAGGMIIIAGIFAIESKKLIDSIVWLSVVSLISVFLFIVLRAPDVAITEAAVSAGLVTAVFLTALFRISKGGEEK